MNFNKLADSQHISQKTMDLYYREKLVRRLVISLEDQIEKNREISIEIFTKMIERVGFKDEGSFMLPAIANRMAKIPYAEECKYLDVDTNL